METNTMLNKFMGIGNLGKDPETRYLQDGTAVTNFTIATSEKWKDKNTGEKREKTEWISCVAWRRLAEICGEYLSKGSKVYVEGKMQTRSWEPEDGGKTRYKTEVVISEMTMLGGNKKQDAGDQGYGAPPSGGAAPGGKTYPGADEDIPF